MNQIADAIREVTAKMQKALDAGKRSRQIDAEDLIDILLSVADEIDSANDCSVENHSCEEEQ